MLVAVRAPYAVYLPTRLPRLRLRTVRWIVRLRRAVRAHALAPSRVLRHVAVVRWIVAVARVGIYAPSLLDPLLFVVKLRLVLARPVSQTAIARGFALSEEPGGQ